MSLKTIRIALTLDDKGYHASIERAGRKTRRFRREFDKSAKSLRRMEHHLTRTVARLRDFLIVASVMSRGIETVVRATLGWQLAIVKTNAEIERMTVLLEGMSEATSAIGRAAEAQQSVDNLFDKALQTPFNIKALTDSFVKMKSVGIDPTRGGLDALTDSVAAFGGNDDLLARASIAIQQMGGKGVISMEELRQQLGEAVPSAIKLMARSMNVTFKQLVDLVSEGRVEALSATNLMFEEMNRTFDGKGSRLMKTWSGMMSQLSTRWDLMQREIGKAGFFDAAKESMEDLLSVFDDIRVKQAAASIGQSLASLIESTQRGIEVLLKYRDEIGATVKALFLFWAAVKAGKILSKLTALTIGASRAVRFHGIMMARAKGYTNAWVAANRGAVISLGALRASVLGVSGVIGALGGPIGLLVTALGTAAIAWDLFGDSAEDAAKKARKGFLVGSLDELNELGDKITQQRDRVAGLKAELRDKKFSNDRANHKRQNGGFASPFASTSTDVRETENELRGHQSILNDLIVQAENSKIAIMRQFARQGASLQKDALRERLEQVRTHYKSERELLQGALNDGVFGQFAASESAAVSIRELYRGIIKVHDESIKELEKTLEDSNLSDAATKTIEGRIAASQAAIKEAQEKRKTDLENNEIGATILQPDKSKTIDTFLKNLAKKTQGYQADLAGLNGEVAKFRHMITEAGLDEDRMFFRKFGIHIDEAEAAIREYTKAKDDLKNNKKALADEEQAMKQLKDAVGDAEAEVGNLMGSLSSGGNENAGSALNTARRLAEELKDKLTPVKRESREVKQLLDALFAGARTTDVLSNLDALQQKTRDIKIGLMTERDAIRARYDYEVQKIKETTDFSQLEGEARVQAQRVQAEALKALADKRARDLEHPVKTLSRNWADASTRMKEASADWLEDATNRLTDFVMTGKLNFSDFAKSVVADLVKIQLQEAASGIFGGTQGNVIAGMQSFFGFATGGVMSGSGPETLRKYASGGIANSPQLAMFGEGSRPEAYVPLPDGRSIPVTMSGGGGGGVQINIIEAPGTQASVSEGQDENGGLTMDVVIEKIENGISKNVSEGRGSMSKTLEGTYGLNRASGSMR